MISVAYKRLGKEWIWGQRNYDTAKTKHIRRQRRAESSIFFKISVCVLSLSAAACSRVFTPYSHRVFSLSLFLSVRLLTKEYIKCGATWGRRPRSPLKWRDRCTIARRTVTAVEWEANSKRRPRPPRPTSSIQRASSTAPSSVKHSRFSTATKTSPYRTWPNLDCTS